MKEIFAAILISILLFGCSSSDDITMMSPEDGLAYAMELYNDEDYQYSQREFQSLVLQYPGSTITDDAQFYLGMSYYNDDQFLLAAYEFSKLLRDIRGSEYVPKSQFMLAESYYQLSPPYQLDQTYTTKAITEFQSFIEFFPIDPKVEEAERKIHELNLKLAEKEFNSARIYEKMEYYNASMDYYTKVYETYHDTEFAPKALYRKILILLDKEKFATAFDNINVYLEKYPEAENAEEIREIHDNMAFK
ncbi:MAG: outer membrane protein assembly factor BamD [Bacteroidota bacterium]